MGNITHLAILTVRLKVSNCEDLVQLYELLENMDYSFIENEADRLAGRIIADTEIMGWKDADPITGWSE